MLFQGDYIPLRTAGSRDHAQGASEYKTSEPEPPSGAGRSDALGRMMDRRGMDYITFVLQRKELQYCISMDPLPPSEKLKKETRLYTGEGPSTT